MLLGTVTPVGREVGTGKIGEWATIYGISATACGETSTDREVPPLSSPMHRPNAPTDGRRSRPQQYNMEFRLSPSTSHPPLTDSFWSIDLDCMDCGYNRIAVSIGDFEMHQYV